MMASEGADRQTGDHGRVAVVEEELRSRAERRLARDVLVVDYYRIRRKLGFSLPLRELPAFGRTVDGIQDYPWAIWLAWELEERITVLGWVAEWLGDARARQAARTDLDALAAWPTYCEREAGNLSTPHLARVLATGLRRWSWVDEPLSGRIRVALGRALDDLVPASDARYDPYATIEEILAAEGRYWLVQNIPVIGSLAAARAARLISHEAAPRLDARANLLLSALTAYRADGFSEGVAYDGYVMDFAADWIAGLPLAERREAIDRFGFADELDQSLFLGAPGRMVEAAELGDVEPVEMPFHLAGHAKLQALLPVARRGWYLSQCELERFPATGLAALVDADVERPVVEAPVAGALDAHYAVVLRSGWEGDDLAVAMGASNSPMDHIHCDAGSMVVGLRGAWLLGDPGYQQYMPTSERDFTLGPGAHNAPVLNGHAQERKACRRMALEAGSEGLWHAALDLTACYPEALSLERVERSVWLRGSDLVVVADRVVGEGVESIGYSWHGHKAAAWLTADGWAGIHLHPTTLWLTSPQAVVEPFAIDRRRGSRGQMTLAVAADAAAPVIWWVFSVDKRPARVETTGDGERLRVGDDVFG